MNWDLKTLTMSDDDTCSGAHECATCRLKERVYVKTPNGKQHAAIWRCRVLSQLTREEILVQPHENCFDHGSLSDHWEESEMALVR